MSNDAIKRLTFKDIIAKKTLLERNKKEFRDIYCPSLEGNLLFKLPSDEEILDLMDGIDEKDTRQVYEKAKKLIYTNCEALKSKELHEAFEIVDPFDIVSKIFSMGQVLKIFEKLTEHLDLDEFSEQIKN